MRNREKLIQNTVVLSACNDQFVEAGVSLLDRILDQDLETCSGVFAKIMEGIDELKRTGSKEDDLNKIFVAVFAAAGFGVCMERVCQRAIGGDDDE